MLLRHCDCRNGYGWGLFGDAVKVVAAVDGQALNLRRLSDQSHDHIAKTIGLRAVSELSLVLQCLKSPSDSGLWRTPEPSAKADCVLGQMSPKSKAVENCSV